MLHGLPLPLLLPTQLWTRSDWCLGRTNGISLIRLPPVSCCRSKPGSYSSIEQRLTIETLSLIFLPFAPLPVARLGMIMRREGTPPASQLSIADMKLLYEESTGGRPDADRLRQIIIQLYSRVLELMDALIGLQEERAELLHERDLLTKVNMRLDEAVGRLRDQLTQREMEVALLEQRVEELGETSSKLTQWNTALEEEREQQAASLRAVHEREALQQHLAREEALEATRKLIALRGQLDEVEEELARVYLTSRENGEIVAKLRQENAILKSKLYDVHVKGGGSRDEEAGPHERGSLSTRSLSVGNSGEPWPLLDTISLDSPSSSHFVELINKIRGGRQ